MLKSDLTDFWDPIESNKFLYRSLIRESELNRINISSLTEEHQIFMSHRNARYEPQFWFIEEDILQELAKEKLDVEAAYDKLITEYAELVEQMNGLRSILKQKHKALLYFFIVSSEVLENKQPPVESDIDTVTEISNAKDKIKTLIKEIMNLSLTCSQSDAKCAFLDKKIQSLSFKVEKEEVKDSEKSVELLSTKLEALEIQNTILNELLGQVTLKIKAIDVQMTLINERRSLSLVQVCKRQHKATTRMLEEMYPSILEKALEERKKFKKDLEWETSRDLHVSKFDMDPETKVRLNYIRREMKELIVIADKLNKVRQKIIRGFY